MEGLLLVDGQGDLPSRSQYDGKDGGRVIGQFLKHRNGKSNGLAGSCAATTDTVSPLDDFRDATLLNAGGTLNGHIGQ